jgi:flagella synthesis protein FlgN
MTHPAGPQLLAALSEELLAVREFVELLHREQHLLIENQTDLLLALADQKSAQAIHLNQLAATRRDLLLKQIPELSQASIAQWLGANSKEGLTIWHELRTLAEQSRDLNNTNGEVIQIKLRHIQQTLTALGGAVRHANLYGPDGQPSFSTGSGRSLGNG